MIYNDEDYENASFAVQEGAPRGRAPDGYLDTRDPDTILRHMRALVWPDGPETEWVVETIEDVACLLRAAGYGPVDHPMYAPDVTEDEPKVQLENERDEPVTDEDRERARTLHASYAVRDLMPRGGGR